jgi:hypothetical protein
MAISRCDMKGNQIKRYNPKTAKRHKKLLDQCQKTTLQRVKYRQDENGKAIVTGTEILASHAPIVCQEVRKMGVLPVDRVAYKKGKVKSINDPGKMPLINKYSKDSVAAWNFRKDKP